MRFRIPITHVVAHLGPDRLEIYEKRVVRICPSTFEVHRHVVSQVRFGRGPGWRDPLPDPDSITWTYSGRSRFGIGYRDTELGRSVLGRRRPHDLPLDKIRFQTELNPLGQTGPSLEFHHGLILDQTGRRLPVPHGAAWLWKPVSGGDLVLDYTGIGGLDLIHGVAGNTLWPRDPSGSRRPL